MSVEKSEINPRAYEQWDLWKVGVFGGLPWRAVLSRTPLELFPGDEKIIQRFISMKEELFLLASLKSNLYLPEDENEKITIPDKYYSPMFDWLVQYQQDLCFEGDLLTCSIREISEAKNYHITQQSVAFYLENKPIKEELKEHFSSLVSLICDYLNRDKKRMELAQDCIIRKGELIDSKNAKDIFKEALEDRESTTAQIYALCSNKIISPKKAENSTAGQESTLEGTTEAQSIEPPIEIQERFKKFVDDGILCIFPEPINGRKRYFLKSKSASDFFILFKKHQDKEKLPQMSARVLNEWIYRRTGKPYSKSSFYKHY